MNDKLLDKVDLWADKYGVLKSGTIVVVGVSGGSDSVCLLHILYTLSKKRNFSVFAVHVNHMLRGEESDGDELFVRNLCAEYGIPLKVYRENVAAFAKENNCSVEEAGRLIRYKRLNEVLNEAGASHIAVAHHMYDQAETVFMNLLRGAGMDGLCGMSDINGKIIRPLLNVSKNEIKSYINRNGLSYRTDSSNYENTYLRNAIRNVIFPEISRETGINIASSLVRMQKLLMADRDFLNQYAEKKFKDLLTFAEDRKVVLKRYELGKLHPAVAGRVVRIAWEKITGSLKGLESVHVNNVLDIVSKDGNRTVDLPKGVKAETEYDNLEIATSAFKERTENFSVGLSVPSVVGLPRNKIRIETRLYTRAEFINEFGDLKKAKENSLTQIFDYAKIKEGIFIRSRLPGDIFYPYNSRGRKKLKDFFIDEKIPKNIRESIPLLAEGGNIIWVVGFRTAENYKVTDSTEMILYVNIKFI